jgi:hypothetical protein
VEVAEKMVSLDWSAGRIKPDLIKLKNQPNLFVLAREMHDSGRQVFILRKDEFFAVTSSSHSNLQSKDVKQASNLLYSSEFDSFADFLDARFKVILLDFVY